VTEVDDRPSGRRSFSGSLSDSSRTLSTRCVRAARGSEATSLDVAYRSARRFEAMTCVMGNSRRSNGRKGGQASTDSPLWAIRRSLIGCIGKAVAPYSSNVEPILVGELKIPRRLIRKPDLKASRVRHGRTRKECIQRLLQLLVFWVADVEFAVAGLPDLTEVDAVPRPHVNRHRDLLSVGLGGRTGTLRMSHARRKGQGRGGSTFPRPNPRSPSRVPASRLCATAQRAND
jgi:hypothetical protein